MTAAAVVGRFDIHIRGQFVEALRRDRQPVAAGSQPHESRLTRLAGRDGSLGDARGRGISGYGFDGDGGVGHGLALHGASRDDERRRG